MLSKYRSGVTRTLHHSFRMTLLFLLALFTIAACSSDDDDNATSVTTRDSGMIVTVQSANGVNVHTLTAPESVFANSTHFVETENSLIAVDTQFLLPNAQDMRAYADETGKTIDRVFITHEHPDHFLGSEAFNDRPVYALQAVSDLTEAATQLVVRLPDHGVVITGDIVYSGVHLILAGQIDPWTTALENLGATSEDYPIVLAGHGLPASPDVYDTNISWLAKAAELIGMVDNGADFKQGLIDAFPDLGMPAAIDFVLGVLFPDG